MPEAGEAIHPADPFKDPARSTSELDSSSPGPTPGAADVLVVDRNATLTLGEDSLVVLDEGLKHRRAAANFCGLLPQLTKTTKAIPFYNVLWAELSDFDVTIRYAEPAGKRACTVGYINYTVTDKSVHAQAQRWVERLMDRAYPANTKRRQRVKVLINPFGGQGYAQKLWTREIEPLFAAAHFDVDVERTTHRGHAIEIAEKLDVEAYDVIACASGDGLPHEVFNGLAKQLDARRALRKIAVVQLPCGSGNAMSVNLNGTDSASLATLAIVKGIRTPMDLVAITQGNNTYYSFLSQAVGIVAESDLGTESLRWMGSFRFTWGVLVRLMGKNLYPAEVSVMLDSDDKNAIKEGYRNAIREYDTRRKKQLTHEDHEEDLIEGQSQQLPQLRYGTVQDPLPSAFQTQDMPALGNFYAGNMAWLSADVCFFGTSLPSDGKLDMINISSFLPRTTSLHILATASNGALIDYPDVSYRKVLAYRITPRMDQTEQKLRARFIRWLGGAGEQREGLIAIDGERVPFEPFQAEVVQGLGTVLSKSGGVYESPGLKESF